MQLLVKMIIQQILHNISRLDENAAKTSNAGHDAKVQNMEVTYDNLTIMPKLRLTYDRRLIHKTSYEGHKAFLAYNSLVKS